MKDARYLVDIIIMDGNSCMTAVADQLDYLTQRGIYWRCRNLCARNHNGVGPDLFQVQHAINHVGFFIADKAFGLSFINKVMDFFRKVVAVDRVEFFSDQGFEESK